MCPLRQAQVHQRRHRRTAGGSPVVLEQDPDLRRALRELAGDRRFLFIAGLPGAGKSLVVQQAALVAAEAGRTVHLLQWDVVRLPFDAPEILARYPEVDGVTDAAIRLAVGRWSRGAVLRWHHDHPGGRDILIGETPLVGERLMELARRRDDDLEPLLAGKRCVFLVPVPSDDVRRAIEDARAQEMADPRHARDTKSAPPELVRWHWDEIDRVAVALGAAHVSRAGGYDPERYAGVYRALLRHRRVRIVPLTRVLRVAGSVHGPLAGTREIVPSPDEVARAMTEVERLPRGEIDRRALEWYRA